MNTYTIDQLINLQQVQSLLETHTRLSGMTCGLMDNEGNIITGAGLQQVCTAFHWTHPASFARCWRNDPEIKQKLQTLNGDLFECRCQNGMVNIAMPIIIEGNRLAVFFSGQFFYEDAPPDLAWFQIQAEELGFEIEPYLAAVRQVPLFSRSHVDSTMRFLHQLVQLLADNGHTNQMRLRELEELKRVERELFILTGAINNATDAFFLVNEQFRFVYVNDAACSSLGYSREELLTMGTQDIDPGMSPEELEALKESAVEHGRLKPFETRHRTKDGRIFPVDVSATPFEFDGVMLGLVMARDITERKQMEQQLQQQIAFKQTLLDCIAMVGIQVMVIENGRIIYVGNRDLAYGFGYTDAELDAHPPFIEIIHPDERERIMDYHRRRLDGEAAPTTYEIGLMTKAGERLDYETAVITLPDTDPVRIITVGKNISERKQTEQQIKLLNYALDHVSDAVFLKDINEGRFLYVNQEACRSLGYSRDELIGMSTLAINPNLSAESYKKLGAELLNQGSKTFETTHLAKSGTLFPVEISATIFEYDGTHYSFALVRNITERKQTEQQLNLLSHALDHVWEGAFLIDLQGRFIYVNQAACRSLGYNRDELLGKTVSDIDPDFSASRTEEHLAELFEVQTLTFETRHRTRTGDTFPVEITTSVFEYGGVNYFLALVRNIVERKRMETMLAEREREFRTLAENSPDNIVRYDTQCRMVYVNPRMEKTLGIPAAALLGKTPMEKPPGTERGTYQEKIRQVLTTGNEAEIDLILPDSGEGVRHHNIRFVTERDDDGSIAGVLAIGRDITERKQAEQRLHEKQQKLTEIALELSLAEERERQRIAAELHDHLSQSLLLGKIKLRSLISSPTVNDRHLLEEMLELQDRMIRSVRSLTQQLSPPILAVAGLMDALRWLAERMQEDYGLQVQVVDNKQPIPLADDMRAIVFQACRELLINVAKHAQTETARVIVGRERDHLHLTVEDRGVGFDFSGSTVNGFGLFSISERINYLGGHLMIESAPGRGTRVVLRVALAENREQAISMNL